MSKRKRRRHFPVPDAPDPRLIATEVTHIDGNPVEEGTFVFVVSPVRLGDDRLVFYNSPAVVDFYLLEALRLRNCGEKKRRRALSDLRAEDDGSYRLRNQPLLLDAVASLTTAILLSVGAIEAFANIMVERLPEDAEIDCSGKKGSVNREEMVRRLSLREKLDLAVPRATGRQSVKGTDSWQRFFHLCKLRNDLTHVKDGGYSSEADDPSGFGRLVRGDGANCVEDAFGIINACDPEWPSPRIASSFR